MNMKNLVSRRTNKMNSSLVIGILLLGMLLLFFHIYSEINYIKKRDKDCEKWGRKRK